MDSPLAAIFGCSGTTLTDFERGFFRETAPTGFILFARNVDTPDQVRRLVSDLREAGGREDALVLIDQEGGKVQRLGPPHWGTFPAASEFWAVPDRRAKEATFLNARLIAHDLFDLGIDVNCLPVLDLPVSGADAIIGDRAVGCSVTEAESLGRAVCGGLLAGGVLPVIKHIPGHGRATADSHKALPVVDAEPWELDTIDFQPFRAMARMPLAMTAHVVYSALDAENPATLSKTVIEQAIRGRIGFNGLLITDDLSMKALSGDFSSRARDALAAGCDVVLHCNGDADEMTLVAEGTSRLSDEGVVRLGKALKLKREPGDFDPAAARAQVGQLLGREVYPS